MNDHAPLTGSAFAHVDQWVFDLDNTLYPSHCDLFAQVDERMCAFIGDYLKVDPVRAKEIQKGFYIEHGTTLAGLMKVHGMDPADFLAFVHDIDVSPVEPNPALGALIDRLPGRKLIFTNGSVAHAENVLARLGIAHVFDDIYDIVATDYAPKPRQEAYERMIARSGLAPESAAMFEDIARNLEVPHALGMATVWVRPGIMGPERHHSLSHEGADGPHVHHVTGDLAAFLTGLLKTA
ncbi:MAG: pyrimidine 5'-nucleotidase [Parvibaculaceae bacterium]|nr:pyrimidine 5'-nucleotidase [Parvibaculaceae bacterium]